jgi:hypothetical protein
MTICRSSVVGLAFALAGLLLAATASAETLTVSGPTASWHGANVEATMSPPSAGPAVGDNAYDHHFLVTGAPPEWPFLTALPAAPSRIARIENGEVVFTASGARVRLTGTGIPDIATPAEPYLLYAPAAERLLAVEPYYLLRDKETRYVVTVYTPDGHATAHFDTLPTHALAGLADVLVAPARTGCCETMMWSVRVYDLTSGTVFAKECPPGQCGDMVLARLAGGELLLGMEEFATYPAQGSSVTTRLLVMSSRGAPLANATFVHAYRDASIGVANTGTCGTRTLVADRSAFALPSLAAVTPAPDGAWTIRFKQSAWRVSGLADTAPDVSFLPVFGMKP